MTSPELGGSISAAWDPKRLLIDAAAVLGLVLALGITFAVDRMTRASATGGQATGAQGKPSAAAQQGPAAVKASPLRLAVTLREYDDMGQLLASLGPGYRYRTIAFDDLLDADRLAENDVVFLTCGGVPAEWLGRKLRPSERDFGGVFEARPEIVQKLKESLREYVRRGGTLYASDYRFQLLKLAFPEMVDPSRESRGEVQTVLAQVVDPGLQKQLGATMELRFDKRAWYPAAFRGAEVTTYLTGPYQTIDGRQLTGPLLVTFPFGEGTVIFTSFHNEAQNSQTELKLLRYLAFASVTAHEEALVRRTLRQGGFSPTERNLLSASRENEPVRDAYECRRAGPLQFVLSFENRGARLRLEVVGPDGDRHEKTGTWTFTIEVPQAAAGKWQYTITPLEVPYKNFAFTLTVAEKG